MKLLALLSLVACVASQAELPFTEPCTDNIAKISAVIATPDPTTIADIPSNITATFDGILSQEVTEGTFEFVATVLGLEVLREEGDVCSLIPGGCPLPAGDIPEDRKISKTVELTACPPFNQPVIVDVKATDSDGGAIACVQFSFSVGCS